MFNDQKSLLSHFQPHVVVQQADVFDMRGQDVICMSSLSVTVTQSQMLRLQNASA